MGKKTLPDVVVWVDDCTCKRKARLSTEYLCAYFKVDAQTTTTKTLKSIMKSNFQTFTASLSAMNGLLDIVVVPAGETRLLEIVGCKKLRDQDAQQLFDLYDQSNGSSGSGGSRDQRRRSHKRSAEGLEGVEDSSSGTAKKKKTLTKIKMKEASESPIVLLDD